MIKHFMKSLNSREGRMDRPLGIKLLYCGISLLVILVFSNNGLSQNLPSEDKCTSKDLELVGAKLSDSDKCVKCSENQPLDAQQLILSINNKTGSTRTSFAFWATLEIYNADNTTGVADRTIPVYGCVGGIPKNATTPKPVDVNTNVSNVSDVISGGQIKLLCGQRLRLVNLFLAWTDASPKSTCETIDPVTIAPKCGTLPDIEVNTGLHAVPTVNHIACNGGSATGSISVLATGGAGGPYKYKLDNGNFQENNNFSGLAAGVYTVTVQDVKGCTTTPQQVRVNEPGAITATITAIPVSCNGGSDGSIVVSSASGGSGEYKYSINGASWETTGNFTGLSAGNYTVAVKDVNNCTTTQSVEIIEPSTLSASASVTSPIACNGNKATVTVSGSGGTGDLTYVLNGVSNSTGTFTEVPAGQNFTWSVTDAKGCSKTGVLTVSQPDELRATINSQVNVSCNGGQNGSVVITGSGGNAGYMYSSNGKDWQASGSFANLSAGNYTLTVKDAKGCTTTEQVNITQPNVVTANASVTTAIACNGGTATISITASGGTEVFSYTFNGQTNSTGVFTGVRAGQNYVWSVSDGNSCVKSGTLNVTEPEALNASITSQENISCFGANDGTISVNVTGGTTPYSYDWADLSGDNDPKDRTGLTAGNYSMTVSDAKGCSFVLITAITEGKRLEKPVVIIHDGVNSLCSTPTLPSLEVCTPTLDVTYVLYDKDNKKISEVTPGLASPNVVFTGLEPGSGFKVVARFGNCESNATVCGEQFTTCPQQLTSTQTSTSSIQTSEQPKLKEDQLTAYPIPFSENVTLEFKAERDGNYEINLYDMKGTLVRKLKAGTARAGEVTQIEVDGRMMAEGVYLARMVSNSGAKTVKLLKKK